MNHTDRQYIIDAVSVLPDIASMCFIVTASGIIRKHMQVRSVIQKISAQRIGSWVRWDEMTTIIHKVQDNLDWDALRLEYGQDPRVIAEIALNKSQYIPPAKREKTASVPRSEDYGDQETITVTLNKRILLGLVKSNPMIVTGVDEVPVEVQSAVIERAANNIQYIRNPTSEIKTEAVSRGTATTITKIDNPTDEMIITAIKRTYTTLRHIKPHTEAMQITAINQNIDAFKLIKNPTDKAIQLYNMLYKI